MENHTKNTPTKGNPLYTEAEQRAILLVRFYVSFGVVPYVLEGAA